MVALSFIVGVVGNVVSVLVFASPIPTFCRIVKSGSTEDFAGLPYVWTLLQALMWFYYGITKPGGFLIAFLNAVGSVFELIYVTLFLIYAPSSIRAKTAIWAAILDVVFPVAAVLVTSLAMHGNLRIDVIGFMCATLCIIMYGSPLVIMKTVITTKSVEYMPFLLSFFIFINGAIWTFYGVLVGDIFLMVSNGVGFGLGIAQLLLYAIYSNGKGAKSRSQGLEDGNQPLINPAEVHEIDGEVTNKNGSPYTGSSHQLTL